MDIDLISKLINTVFIWDGWRALAAIGTFAAVLVALRRDSDTNRDQKIRFAYFLTAILDEVSACSKTLDMLSGAAIGSAAEKKLFSYIDASHIFDKTSDTLVGLKMLDLPNVEAMTTVSVLRGAIKTTIPLIIRRRGGEDVDFAAVRRRFAEGVTDLTSERDFVAGKDKIKVTNVGHRTVRDRKLKGSPRMQSLRRLPHLLKTIVTDKG